MKNYDFKTFLKCFALFGWVSWTSAISTIIYIESIILSNRENRLSFILFAVGVFDQLFVVNICASSRAERASKNFMNCWTLEDYREGEEDKSSNIPTRNPSHLLLSEFQTLHQKWFHFSAVFLYLQVQPSALKHDICSAETFEDILWHCQHVAWEFHQSLVVVRWNWMENLNKCQREFPFQFHEILTRSQVVWIGAPSAAAFNSNNNHFQRILLWIQFKWGPKIESCLLCWAAELLKGSKNEIENWKWEKLK